MLRRKSTLRKTARRKNAGRKFADEKMSDQNRSWCEMCVSSFFVLVRLRNYAFSNTLLKIIAIPKFQVVYFHWKWCRYCSWKLTVIFGSVRILTNRVNCPVPNRAEIRTANFQVQYLLQFSHGTSRSQSTHSQEPCEWFGHDIQVLLVKFEQILHLKVDCSDFGPVRDRGSLPYPNA